MMFPGHCLLCEVETMPATIWNLVLSPSSGRGQGEEVNSQLGLLNKAVLYFFIAGLIDSKPLF
jgi:hypothetical protein